MVVKIDKNKWNYKWDMVNIINKIKKKKIFELVKIVVMDA